MKKLFCLVLVTLATVACQHRSDDPIENAKEAAKDKDLQGTFVGACTQRPLDEILADYGKVFSGDKPATALTRPGVVPNRLQTSYTFSGAKLTRETRLYDNGECAKDPVITFTESGTFTGETDPNKLNNDKSRNIEMDFTKLEASVVAAHVDIANQVGFCGLKDWAADGQKREITAENAAKPSCYNAKVPKRHVSNVYKIIKKDETTSLALGTTTKAEVAAKDRPAKVDETTALTKSK